jgi:hypothetical protein
MLPCTWSNERFSIITMTIVSTRWVSSLLSMILQSAGSGQVDTKIGGTFAGASGALQYSPVSLIDNNQSPAASVRAKALEIQPGATSAILPACSRR